MSRKETVSGKVAPPIKEEIEERTGDGGPSKSQLVGAAVRGYLHEPTWVEQWVAGLAQLFVATAVIVAVLGPAAGVWPMHVAWLGAGGLLGTGIALAGLAKTGLIRRIERRLEGAP